MKRFANEFRAILSLSKEKGYKRKTGGKSLKRDGSKGRAGSPGFSLESSRNGGDIQGSWAVALSSKIKCNKVDCTVWTRHGARPAMPSREPSHDLLGQADGDIHDKFNTIERHHDDNGRLSPGSGPFVELRRFSGKRRAVSRCHQSLRIVMIQDFVSGRRPSTAIRQVVRAKRRCLQPHAVD